MEMNGEMNGLETDDGARAGDRRQLGRLVEFRGRARVLEILGVDDDTLTGLLDGRLEWPADAREKFDRAWRMMEQLGAPAEVPSEPPDPAAPDEVDEAAEIKDPAPGFVGDEKPADGAGQAVVDAKPAAAAGGGMVHVRHSVAAAAQDRDLLWRARYLVVTRYLWPERGVPRHRRLSAWAAVLILEIELIRRFPCPLPRPWKRGERWDDGRRQQEISLRVHRLLDVERQVQRQLLRRLADWMLGRDEDPAKLLLQRLEDDAHRLGPVFPLSLTAAEPDWRELERLAPPSP